MRRTAISLLALGLVAALFACGPTTTTTEPTAAAPDSNSGPDATPAGALGMFGVVNDSVNAEEGDNTDYKYIDVEQRGDLDVRVRFHQPTVAGAVSIHDEYGSLVREQPVAMSQQDAAIEGLEVLPGRYYVCIYASEGQSDYAVGHEFQPLVRITDAVDTTSRNPDVAARLHEIAVHPERFPQYDLNGDGIIDAEEWELLRNEVTLEVTGQSSAVVEATRDEDEEEEEERHRRRRHRSRDDDDEDEAEEEEEEAAAATFNPGEEEEEEEAEEEEAGVRASILTVRDRGSGTTLLLRGCGSASSLHEGDRGTIGGTSHRAQITRITGSDNCEAESDATLSQVGTASYVNF